MKKHIRLPLTTHRMMALVYLLLIFLPTCMTIRHTDTEIDYLQKAYDTNNLQNNGAVKEVAVWKEITTQHPFLGPIIKDFFAPSINQQFKIPPEKAARMALDDIPFIEQLEKSEARIARAWSLLLLLFSLTYFGLTVTEPTLTRAHHIFALTIISLAFLVTGILAPAMVLVVSPVTTVFPPFVLHYEVRSIFGVIAELYGSSYWIVAVCLTIFSILIPLTKAALTLLVLEVRSLPNKLKIAQFLHAISKWSMADVFVAAILLSNFAIRANKSTQANLFFGFYYFLSYCLLSMITTTMLENEVRNPHKKEKAQDKKSSKTPWNERWFKNNLLAPVQNLLRTKTLSKLLGRDH